MLADDAIAVGGHRPCGYIDRVCTPLRFHGRVVPGCHRFHTQVVIPGRDALEAACPVGWPELLHPGTLNVQIDPEGRPSAFDTPDGLRALDTGVVAPAFVIPGGRIKGNTLCPTPENPSNGTAQVWRAELEHADGCQPCWVLRRIGSGYSGVLELVSEYHLRNLLGLQPDDPVSVLLYDGPPDQEPDSERGAGTTAS